MRKRLAIVLQDVFLFSGTVAENISLRNKSISTERIIEASKTIGAHPFIMALPGNMILSFQNVEVIFRWVSDSLFLLSEH